MKKKKNYKQEQGNYTLSTKANSKPLFGTSAALHITALGPSRQLSGLVVRMPACCAEGGGSNPGWGAQDFHQQKLSSLSFACDIKLEGALYSVKILCRGKQKTLDIPE